MAKKFCKIFLFIFIKSFIVCSANGALNSSLPEEPSTSTDEITEALLIDGSTAPIAIEGTPNKTTVISVNGTIKTIRDLVHNKTVKIEAPVLVHATQENSTYLLVNQTQNHKRNILVYPAVDNTTTYLLAGVLKTPGLLGASNGDIKTFTANSLQDVIDVLPKNFSEPHHDHDLPGSHLIDDHNSSSTKPHNHDQTGSYIIDVGDSILSICPKVEISYYVYKRPKFESPLDFLNVHFLDPSKKTTLLIHGWRNTGTEPDKFSQRLKNAILKTEDQNVIVVSWTASLNYFCALSAMKEVGRRAAGYVNILMEDYKISPKTFHLMGHSLGGHVVGYVGNSSDKLLERITSFDPAHPMISCSKENECIDKANALFVDVIHTDGGRTGKSEPLGDVDFYPNSGEHSQPHCGTQIVITSCSHAAGFMYYEEAILSGDKGLKFHAAKSDSYHDFKKGKCTAKNEFGPNVKSYPTGKFYFETSAKKPFALGDKGMSEDCWGSI